MIVENVHHRVDLLSYGHLVSLLIRCGKYQDSLIVAVHLSHVEEPRDAYLDWDRNHVHPLSLSLCC
jgi:hypothetical protein